MFFARLGPGYNVHNADILARDLDKRLAQEIKFTTHYDATGHLYENPDRSKNAYIKLFYYYEAAEILNVYDERFQCFRNDSSDSSDSD